MKFKKIPAILVATHGRACEEIIKTAGMIYGSTDGVHALSLLPEMDPADFQKEIEVFIEQYDGDIIILVDLIGGTPFNSLLKISRTRQLCAVTGVNIPMVVEAMDQRDMDKDAKSLAAHLAEVAKEAVHDSTPMLLGLFDKAQAYTCTKQPS